MLVAFIYGVVFGSFLNVLILRIPKSESIIFGASHCTTCNTKLKAWHNIPLLSWIFLRGKCAYCSSKISLQYPLVELFTGILFAAVISKYSFSLPIVMVLLSFSMLLALSIIDLRYKMVPDSLNLLAILFAILGAWSLEGVFENFKYALLFAGGFTLLRFALSYILTSSAQREAKKQETAWTKHYHTSPYIEAMGEGDIMVAATMGALLGAPLTLVAIFLSAVLALPVMLFMLNKSKEEQRVPYVPFLALATFIVYMYDSQVLNYISVNY